jgi:type IV pilus assembly protein PilF
MGRQSDEPSTQVPGARIHTELGAGYYSRGQYSVALQELNKALNMDRAYAPAYNVLGLVHAELREDKQAESSLRRALELSPNYSDAHNNLGLFLCQRDRYNEALKEFDTALANPLYETPEKALVNYAACALKKGDLAIADEYAERAMRRAPAVASVQLAMAEVYFRKGRWLAARTLLQKIGAYGDLSAQALWLGVRVERQAGDREAENSYATQLKRRFPDDLRTQWLITGQFEQGGSLL